jgi:hypothetical protein
MKQELSDSTKHVVDALSIATVLGTLVEFPYLGDRYGQAFLWKRVNDGLLGNCWSDGHLCPDSD